MTPPLNTSHPYRPVPPPPAARGLWRDVLVCLGAALVFVVSVAVIFKHGAP